MKRPVPAPVVASLSLTLAILAFAFLAFSALAATPTLPIGQETATTGSTNVRATADGTLVGTQPRYAVGIVAAGPVTVVGNSVTWYKVAFNTGPSGWVGADMLIDGLPRPKTVNIGAGLNQDMILDELGNIEMAFNSSSDPGNSVARYSFSETTNQGLTFSKPTVLPMEREFEVPPPNGPEVAAERNGAIDIVYTCGPDQCPFSVGGGNTSVEMIRSIDHGATWSAPIQISVPPHPSESGAGNAVIAACGAGVTVAWTDDGVGSNRFQINDDLFVVQVLNGVPGAPINVTYTVGSESQPQILVNPQGTVYLSWVGVSGVSGGDAGNLPGAVNFASIPNCAAVQQ